MEIPTNLKFFAGLPKLRRQRDPVVSSLKLTLSPDWKPQPKEEVTDPGPPAAISDGVRSIQAELNDLDIQFAGIHKGVRLGWVHEMEYEYIQYLRKKWWIRALPYLSESIGKRIFGLDWLMQVKNAAMDSLGTFHEELHQRLDRVCDFYLNADDASRKSLRDSIINQRKIREALINHLTWCARHLKLPSDAALLKTGLASVSLEDSRLDFRDTLFGLAALYLASVNAGIQPTPEFIAVGLLSSSKPATPGGSSTKAMLTEFEKSLFFEETIAPKLKMTR